MAQVPKLIQHLLDLKVFDLEEVVVDLITESEFTEEQEIELQLNEFDINKIKKCVHVLQNMIVQKSSESLWSTLVEKKLSIKHLQVWIFTILLKGLKLNASYLEKTASILCANLYYLILAAPGFRREYFFHCIVYEKALNVFEMASVLIKHPLKRKADNTLSQQKKKAKHDKSVAQGDKNATTEVIEPDFSTEEIHRIMDFSQNCLYSFNFLLSIMSLREHEVSFMHGLRVITKVISNLGRTATSAITDFNFSLDCDDINEDDNPTLLAYHALFLMISPKHGDIHKTSLMVLKRLLGIVLMSESVVFNSVPKSYVHSSNTAFQFILAMFCKNENEKVMENVRDFLQNVIVQNPDRAEYRTHMAVSVGHLIYEMPISFYSNFVKWLVRFLKHVKVGYRSNVLIVIGHLLCLPERLQEDLSEDSTSHKFLLQTIMHRVVDVAASVRSRALGVLVEIMQSKVVTPEVFTSAANSSQVMLNLLQEVDLSETTTGNEESGGVFASILNHCASWNKSQVRKSAIVSLENALLHEYIPLCKINIQILEERCRDPALIVRKQTVQSITNVLMKYPSSMEMCTSWAQGIFPRIIDPETTVQERVLANVQKVLFDTIQSEARETQNIAWNILDYFTGPEGNGNKVFLENLCVHWFRQNPGNVIICNIVIANLDNELRQSPAWLFIEIITRHVCNENVAKNIYNCYQEQHNSILPLPTHASMIYTMGNISKYVDDETKNIVIGELKDKINTFDWAIQLITPGIECICKLSSAKENINETESNPFSEWCVNVYTECERYIFECFKNISQNHASEDLDYDRIINYVTTAGCASLYTPKQVPKRLLLYMQALLTGIKMDDDVHSSQSSQLTQGVPLSQFRSTAIPNGVRAHVILNLGKMSFFKPSLAKKLVPAMARELEMSNNEMVRSNVLIVLTDLCVLHTQLVDPYISEMSTCFRDESAAVRKHAVTLLTKLLRKEFVKWRGSLLYKYLVCTCDDEKEIQDLARFGLLEQLLINSAGDIFFRHFLELIFYLNSYEHGSYNRFLKTEREIKLFDFSSTKKTAKRMEIYKLMVENMADDHRVKLTSKLCEEVLGAIVDGAIPLNKKTENILCDTLSILCSQEIKLKCLRASTDDDDFEDIPGTQQRNAEKLQQEIKRGFVSQVVKRNLVENIIPIVISLKNFLVEKKSSLTREIMLFLKEIMQDYKAEVQEILAGDKQLASEIEFDIKRFERQQQEREERALAKKLVRRQQLGSNPPSGARSPVVRTPIFFTPGSSTRTSKSNRRKTLSSIQGSLSSAGTPRNRRRTMSSRELLKSANAALIKLKLQQDNEKNQDNNTIDNHTSDIQQIDQSRNRNRLEALKENVVPNLRVNTENMREDNGGNMREGNMDNVREINGNSENGTREKLPTANIENVDASRNTADINPSAMETVLEPEGRGMSTPSKQNSLSLTFSQNEYSRVLSPINQQMETDD